MTDTVAPPAASTAAPAGAPTLSGAGPSRPRRIGLSWLGLLPFFGYVALMFAVPIGFILFDAFRKTTVGAADRDPVTQQFVHTRHTSFTGANISESLQGIYRTSLMTSVELSAIVAIRRRRRSACCWRTPW